MNVKGISGIIAIALLALVMNGCDSRSPDELPELTNLDRTPSFTPALDSNDVVAVVNGVEVKAGPVEEILQNRVMQQQMQSGTPLSAQEIDQKRRMLIDQLIIEEVIKQAVDASTITVTEAEIDTRLEAAAEQFGGMTMFTQYLESVGYTLEALRNDAKIDAKAAAMMQSQLGSMTVSVDKAAAYYEENPDEFVFPEQVTASHILLKVGPETSAEEQSNIVKRLLDIKQKIAAGEMTFGEAAKQYSECPSAEYMGRIGAVKKDDPGVSKPFADAAFATPVSNVSDVVQSEFGSHLIYITSHQAMHTAEYENVETAIVNYLNQIKQREMIREWTQKLRAKAKVEYK